MSNGQFPLTSSSYPSSSKKIIWPIVTNPCLTFREEIEFIECDWCTCRIQGQQFDQLACCGRNYHISCIDEIGNQQRPLDPRSACKLVGSENIFFLLSGRSMKEIWQAFHPIKRLMA